MLLWKLVVSMLSYVRYLMVMGLFVVFSVTPVLAKTTADHSKYKELNKTFKTAPEVTRACLTCHTEASKQIHKTKHWSWEFLNPENNQLLGKRHILNNFCITPQSNYSHCTSCHIGYGWKDENFDFTAEDKVDCLICHDTTGTYGKSPGNAGFPDDYVDLKVVAQGVGATSRDTCGACHFYGGGGDGVKHGDMDSSLAVPEREVDVHMDALGADFTCSTCHRGSGHDVVGSRYTPVAADTEGRHIRGKLGRENTATCRSCHDDAPHSSSHDKLNQHSVRIACQTCHIPTIARGGVATKMTWDWSTAGQLGDDGKPLVKKDDKGHVVYDGKKGDFSYGENIAPDYTWFNGKVNYMLLDDEVDKQAGVTAINSFGGSANDGKSRIWPVKVFRGKQPYDPVNKTLVVPHTAGKDESAYWANFNWNKAIEHGMKFAGRPFSGEVDFIETSMSWPITHMVAPAENALDCVDCHSKDGRLQDIEGIYIPGRDSVEWLDKAGWIIVLLSLLGVFAHGAIRYLARKRQS